MSEIKHIAIIGAGPVGSFMAVLCSLLDFKVTIYEKREKYTRNINIKIDSNFFGTVQEVITRLNVNNDFFASFNELLSNQNNKILIKELEEMFAMKAISLGAKFIRREIKSCSELDEEVKASDPVILDCTGKNSVLRSNILGGDKYNLVSIPLQNAMYITFKAKVANDISLYQALKYVSDIKLTKAVVSKCIDKNGYQNVTLPVFITSELARIFDVEYPNINREPVNPFNSPKPVNESIFFPISALMGNIISDGCIVDLNSVKVKKIEISCGYAEKRSERRYVCLGDSAIHLAFFRSLNLGLKHALEFFIKLSMFQNKINVRRVKDDGVIRSFIQQNPHLNPIKVYATSARNVFLVVTKVIWYGCFSYSFTSRTTERLTGLLGVTKNDIGCIHSELNRKLSSWQRALSDFEAKRKEDIENELTSNQTKSVIYDYTSFLIDINGLSFIKISELARVISGKNSLYPSDFEFFLLCFKIRREKFTHYKHAAASEKLINVARSVLINSEIPASHYLIHVCESSDLTTEMKIWIISQKINDIHKECISENILKKFKSYTNLTNVNHDDFVINFIRNELNIFLTSVSSDSTNDDECAKLLHYVIL